MNKIIKNSAFTLAEVLITLAIIGIVAAMTIPTLLNNTSDKQTVSALKKSYSTLSQAFNLAVQENGTPDNWNIWDDNEGSMPALKKLVPYLNITKDCTNGETGCFPQSKYKNLGIGEEPDSFDEDGRPKIQLSDGTLIEAYVEDGQCSSNIGSTLQLQNMCGRYIVDINGFKSPNQWGKDLFWFWLTKGGIVPTGTQPDTDMIFVDYCGSVNAYGYSCAAWILYNENMDYLKCPDLTWGGKTKCS